MIARDRVDCNLRLPLWQLVRASTAAPTYFPPEVIDVGEPRFTFVDGGITPYNNPALQLYLMATVPEYKLAWPVGEENLLVVSIGTGISPEANENLVPGEMNLLYNAASLPSALMFGALYQRDYCVVYKANVCTAINWIVKSAICAAIRAKRECASNSPTFVTTLS